MDDLTCDSCGAPCSVAYCGEGGADAPQRCTRCYIEWLERQLDEAEEALGHGWLIDGVSLAEGIRRKSEALEELANG